MREGMSQILWILSSIALLVTGIVSFRLLVKRYRKELLPQFSQKVQMTLFLGISYTLLFFLLNGVLILWLKPLILETETLTVDAIWPLIRLCLAFFALNSILILLVRSLIKTFAKAFSIRK